ncbi:DMT family transporter [Staphylococcus nepalensis]|uniref:DMT family transporter n=2 Tax=Staphylococcus nepalensis TaxID=214473 RepID=UPI0020CB6F36|nr:DMT family transporter [Staphylococcus nepalensis]
MVINILLKMGSVSNLIFSNIIDKGNLIKNRIICDMLPLVSDIAKKNRMNPNNEFILFFQLTIYTIIAGALFMVIFLPGSFSELQTANMTSILSAIYLGTFPTVIPYIALAYTIQKIGVSDATISLYLTPVVSLIIAYFMLGEIPTLYAIIGGIITLIGVTITSANAEESVDLK